MTDFICATAKKRPFCKTSVSGVDRHTFIVGHEARPDPVGSKIIIAAGQDESVFVQIKEKACLAVAAH